MESTDDQQPVEKTKADDADTFLDIIAPHLAAVSRLCASMLHNRADADDVTQQTVLKALKNIHQLREDSCIRGWLFQIALNEARMKMRSTRRFWIASEQDSSAGGQDEPERETLLQRIPDTRETPDRLIERREQERAIKRALARLDVKYREVFVLRDMQGLNGAHTAQILQITEATMHTRLRRARLQMRKMLMRYFRPGQARWKPFQMFRMMSDMARVQRMKVISCQKVLKHLSAYVDLEVCEETKHEIEEHVKVCSRCALILDTLKQTLRLVADEELFVEEFSCKKDWNRMLATFGAAGTKESSPPVPKPRP